MGHFLKCYRLLSWYEFFRWLGTGNVCFAISPTPPPHIPYKSGDYLSHLKTTPKLYPSRKRDERGYFCPQPWPHHGRRYQGPNHPYGGRL